MKLIGDHTPTYYPTTWLSFYKALETMAHKLDRDAKYPPSEFAVLYAIRRAVVGPRATLRKVIVGAALAGFPIYLQGRSFHRVLYEHHFPEGTNESYWKSKDSRS